jgi:hypothetical protein
MMAAMEVVAARSFPLLYVWLDLAWLAAFTGLLVGFRRYQALLAGLAGGVIYFLVDYGVFFLLLGTRSVQGASPFWLLLWLSFSYGLTNFAWIWLLLDRDGHAAEWSLAIVAAWMAVALLADGFGSRFPQVATNRGTGSYHGVMALVLLVGYAALILGNLRLGPRSPQRVDLVRLLAIGVGVQLAWEAVLLLSGIRPAGWRALAVNSLVETNLGLPYLYLIHRALARRIGEDLRRR